MRFGEWELKLLSIDQHAGTHSNYQHTVKLKNLKRAFDLIRNGRCDSRAALAREMNLSATAVSALVEELVRANMVLEAGATHTAVPGRRAMKYVLNRAGHQMSVFSLSSHGVRYTLFDLSCSVIEQLTFPIPDLNGAAHPGEVLADYIEDILLHRSTRFDARLAIMIGLSFPGIYLEDEQIFFVESAMNFSFTEASIRALGQKLGIPMLLANVTMCLAYAEQKRLYPEYCDEKRDLLFINICDGVGAGIVVNGDIMAGTFNTAGEMGHMSIDRNGLPCRCGNRGCLERYVNQNTILSLAAEALRGAGISPPDSIEGLTPHISLPCMASVLDDVAQKLTFGIFSMMCATGIRRIVLGGGIEALGSELLVRLRKMISQRRILAERLQLDYALTLPSEDSLGLAMYYLDKAFNVTI